jgi:ABC-type dipeptide/oligopeptide/nickel transport system permease subunit
MAQSHPRSQPLDPLSLTLRDTDTALPAAPWQVEDLIDDASEPGQERTATLRLGGELTARRQRSLWGDAWRRLIRNKLAVIGLVIVTTFALIAIFAPVIAPYGQAEVVDHRLARYAPTWTWPMGLDANGRDMFSRMVYGAQVSLVVGVLAQAIVLLIGVPLGAIAGYFGGRTDNTLMRLVDVIYAIPQLLMVLLFVNWWGPGLFNIFLAIGLVGWVTEARLVRGQFLSLREQEYVGAAQVAGGSGSYIIRKHMLPNSLTPIIVALTFGIPTAIFTEAALSFVGVGIRPPQASWGQMVAEGSKPGYIETDPHMLLFPVLAIGLTMLGFSFLGDGLRDALDPKGSRD